jgi:hypothetical protein
MWNIDRYLRKKSGKKSASAPKNRTVIYLLLTALESANLQKVPG